MAAWIAIATGSAAVLLAVAVGLLARRGARLEDRLRRARNGGPEVAGSLDLDVVMARVLDGSLALARTSTPRTWGSTRRRVARRKRSRKLGRVGRRCRRRKRKGGPGSKLSRPLAGELGPLGSLTVVFRLGARPGATAAGGLVDIVRRAVPALDNAFRYREARRLADLDALTGLRNRRFFHETLQRECTRAHRYGRQPGAARPRPRRLQGDQRAGRASRRRRASSPRRRRACEQFFAHRTSRAASAATSSRSSSPRRAATRLRSCTNASRRRCRRSPIGSHAASDALRRRRRARRGRRRDDVLRTRRRALYRAKQAGKAQLFGDRTRRTALASG